MMDHVGLSVSDFERSKSFFERALAPLGYKCLKEYPGAAGFGADRPDFWIGQSAKLGATHVAFLAADRTIVEKFYTAAIAAGGRDNGKPEFVRNTTRPITAPSCSIPTATTSRLSVTTRE